jgi:hypothetical protein
VGGRQSTERKKTVEEPISINLKSRRELAILSAYLLPHVTDLEERGTLESDTPEFRYVAEKVVKRATRLAILLRRESWEAEVREVQRLQSQADKISSDHLNVYSLDIE